MSSPILRQIPFLLALGATIWCVAIGVSIWRTPRVWVGVTAQAEGDTQPPQTFREERPFGESSPLGMIPLAIPVILAAGATLISRLRAPGFLAVVVVLFLGYVFITGFSIGGAYYGPAALLGAAVLAEVALSWRERRQAVAT